MAPIVRPSLLKSTLGAALAAAAFGLLAQPSADAGASAPAPNRRNADAALVRALKDHRWTLQSATDAAGNPIDALTVQGQPFVLRFDGARVGVQGGCNTMTGTWNLSPHDRLQISRVASTMKACEAPLMDADRALAALLVQPLGARFEPGDRPALLLVSPQQQTLRLAGQRTPESLYGQPTRIFLEVNAQTVPCQPGAGAPIQCLQVRERRYDSKGLRVGEPGPWQAFYNPIEGYTHTPGVRNVLRIDRFQRPHPPADASRYVYVLDLVVESETISK